MSAHIGQMQFDTFGEIFQIKSYFGVFERGILIRTIPTIKIPFIRQYHQNCQAVLALIQALIGRDTFSESLT